MHKQQSNSGGNNNHVDRSDRRADGSGMGPEPDGLSGPPTDFDFSPDKAVPPPPDIGRMSFEDLMGSEVAADIMGAPGPRISVRAYPTIVYSAFKIIRLHHKHLTHVGERSRLVLAHGLAVIEEAHRPLKEEGPQDPETLEGIASTLPRHPSWTQDLLGIPRIRDDFSITAASASQVVDLAERLRWEQTFVVLIALMASMSSCAHLPEKFRTTFATEFDRQVEHL